MTFRAALLDYNSHILCTERDIENLVEIHFPTGEIDQQKKECAINSLRFFFENQSGH